MAGAQAAKRKRDDARVHGTQVLRGGGAQRRAALAAFRLAGAQAYHVCINGIAYSAPFGLIGKPVDVYCTASLIGIFHQGERVASHPLRRPEPGVLRPAFTLDEHRPPRHRAAARLTPEAIREKAAAIGGALTVLSDKLFLAADHPEQAARQVAGLLSLGEKYGADALQTAATAARAIPMAKLPPTSLFFSCLTPTMKSLLYSSSEKTSSAVLVKGSAGRVGPHVYKALSRAGYLPISYGNLVDGHGWAAKWGPLGRSDILDRTLLNEVITRYKPRAIMHFAAFTSAGQANSARERRWEPQIKELDEDSTRGVGLASARRQRLQPNDIGDYVRH